MTVSDSSARMLSDAIAGLAPRPRQATNAMGTVTSVGEAVYVTIDGNGYATPMTGATCAVSVGDRVTVVIDGGSAVVTGNVSRPATGDERANMAMDAASEASATAVEAFETAKEAAQSAGRPQYVWKDSEGLHVTQTPLSAEGGNVLIDSDSIDIRDGSRVLATFGAETARIGSAESDYIATTDPLMNVYVEPGSIGICSRLDKIAMFRGRVENPNIPPLPELYAPGALGVYSDSVLTLAGSGYGAYRRTSAMLGQSSVSITAASSMGDVGNNLTVSGSGIYGSMRDGATQFSLDADGFHTTSAVTVGGGITRELPFDHSDANPSADTAYSGNGWTTQDGSIVGYVRPVRTAAGESVVQLTSSNNASGSQVINRLSLAVGKDGSRRVAISDRAPWLSALGIRTGSVTVTIASGSATGYTDVSWDAIGDTPHVMLTLGGNLTRYADAVLSYLNASSTGCRIYVRKPSNVSADQTFTVHYLAI